MNLAKLSGRALVALIVAAYVVIPTRAVAQTPGSIAGTVVDTSGGVIIGAAVTLLDANGSVRGRTTTDAMGMFSLAGIPPGKYVVRVERQQFAAKRLDVEIAGGAPTTVRVTLEVPAVSETVDVGAKTYVREVAETATKTETLVLDTPQSVEIVTQPILLDQRPTTLTDALYNVSGVSDGGTQRGIDFPLIRGFDASTDVYLDGLRQQHFQENLDYELTGLERVEVLKGPSSTLYGPGSLGGAIDMVSKRPSDVPHFSFEGGVGSYGFGDGEFDLNGPLTSTLSARVNGVYRDQDDFIHDVGRRRIYVAPALTYKPNSKLMVTVLSSYMRDRDDGSYLGLPPQGTILPNPNGSIPLNLNIGEPNWNKLNVDERQLGYSLVYKFSDHVTLHQNARFQSQSALSQLTLSFGLQANLTTLSRGLADFTYADRSVPIDTNLEVRATTGVIRHTVLAGFDFLHQDLTQTFALGFVFPPLNLFAPIYGVPIPTTPLVPNEDFDQHTRLMGIYLQDQMGIGTHLTVVAGGRYEITNTSMTNYLSSGLVTTQPDRVFVPRVGVVYKVTTPVSLYATYARSFNPNFGAAFGGALFEPEIGQIYEAGVKTAAANGRLSSTFAGYTIARSNVLTADPNPAHTGFDIQTGQQRSSGFEADVRYLITPGLMVNATYAYTDIKITEDTQYQGNRPLNVPPNQASLFAHYDFRDGLLHGFSAGVGYRYVGDRQGTLPNTFIIPSYSVVDANITYRRGPVSLQLNLYNVLDKTYFASAAGSGGTGNVLVGEPFTARARLGFAF